MKLKKFKKEQILRKKTAKIFKRKSEFPAKEELNKREALFCILDANVELHPLLKKTVMTKC